MLKKDIKIEEKIIFLGVTILLLLPSIYYLMNGNKISNLVSSFSFFYLPTGVAMANQKGISTGLFLAVMVTLFIIYLSIIKKEQKVFKTNQSMVGFIVAVSVLFTCVLPMASTDIFYYIGTGWSEAKYGVNPYYTSVDEVMQTSEEASQDEILLKTPKVWSNSKVVYGPIWTRICKILSGLSCGSLLIALVLYKTFNLIIHLMNCYVLYKITKKNKLMLIYALNPLILFAGLAEGHNDILTVGMILLALYFFRKKKNIALTVILVAIATAIKYYAILIIPFLIIYHYRKEKIGKRILYASGWAIVFIAVVGCSYLFYSKDGMILEGIHEQQEKFANTFLVSLAVTDYKKAVDINRMLVAIFGVTYVVTILKLLGSKKISFTKNMRIYSNLLLLFIFITITNFQAWYIMWLFSTIVWQRGRMIRFLMNISVAVEIANAVYFLLNESIQYAKYYSLAFVITVIILETTNNRKGEKNAKQLETR